MLVLSRKQNERIRVGDSVVAFLLVGVLRWPLPMVLLGLIPVSMLVAWRRIGR